MDVKLTLCFSTMGDRLENLIPLLANLESEKVTILVVVQKWQSSHRQLTHSCPQAKFIWSDETGLSRSRNLAIKNTDSEFIWLLDDDVIIEPQELRDLLAFLSEQGGKADIYRVRVGCSENRQGLYKQYTEQQRVSRLDLLRMNSIELVVNRRFIADKQLSFNPGIGLGTRFPGSEEIHFLLDAFDAGARIKMLHKVFVYHSCLEGGRRKAESDAIMEIRGATASRFGVLGAALLLRWIARYFIRDKRTSVITSLLKGYLKGYKAYSH